jgi:hypothetical protein
MAMKRIALLACASLMGLLGSSTAGAASLYKYREPGGHILYSQKPVAHAKLLSVLQVQDPLPSAVSRKRAEQEGQQARQQAQQLYEQIMESRRVDVLLAASSQTTEASACALEPRPGERSATVSGRSRLNENYWNRLGVYPATLCSVPCID